MLFNNTATPANTAVQTKRDPGVANRKAPAPRVPLRFPLIQSQPSVLFLHIFLRIVLRNISSELRNFSARILMIISDMSGLSRRDLTQTAHRH